MTKTTRDEPPETVDELEDLLSAPPERLTSALRRVPGDIVILGAGGKMGPSLARMARRTSDAAGSPRKVIGVSRFSSAGSREQLEAWGVETLAADLLDEDAVSRLPDAPLVFFMAGQKFGAAANPSLTWAANCYSPALVAKRYRQSRIALFSSGNVYGTVAATGSGSTERDEPRPLGEYAMSVLGRERVFEYFSRLWGTQMTVLRLNYAVELRYGVLVDLAQKILQGTPIDLAMGAVNVLWQAEANAMALESLLHAASPPHIINLAGSEMLRVRALCGRLGELLGKSSQFHGTESEDALLSDGRLGHELLGPPQVRSDRLLTWTAAWVGSGKPTLGKPTHFQSRDGKF